MAMVGLMLAMLTDILKGKKMSKNLIEFDYIDSKGKHSHRIIWPVNGPTDKYLGIDLSEFPPEEQEFLKDQLDDIYNVYLEEIKQLGLGSNYRYFKEENISGINK